VNEPVAGAVERDTVELRIPAKAEWVAVARLAVAAVASRSDFSLEDIEDIRLAIAEACTSVIRDAQPWDHIAIHCETEPTELVVSVRGGKGTAIRADARSEQGLGILIIQSLMDSVEYRLERDGVVLRMSKRPAPR
jgi:serine/threonine-protein kinase RsbW